MKESLSVANHTPGGPWKRWLADRPNDSPDGRKGLRPSNFSARPRFVALFLVVLWGIATVLVFIRLENKSENEIDRLASALVLRFKVSWISRPDDDDNHHLFRSMNQEYFAEIQENPRLFRQVFLTWIHPRTKKEVILYPPRLIDRNIETLLTRDTLRKPLIDEYRQPLAPSGYLYFELDPWQKQSTPLIFLLTAFNVLLLMLILLFWLTRLTRRYEASQSELEQKKQELIQLERLALAGKLSAGLLHDLKKPVIHIREECREARRGNNEDKSNLSPELLTDIQEQSDLFLAMLRDSGLEDFARRHPTEPEYCDVIDLVERSLRLVEYERNDVEVEVSVEGEVPLVLAHPTHLMQVFSNLILNSYQAMKGKGALKIRIYRALTHDTKNMEGRIPLRPDSIMSTNHQTRQSGSLHGRIPVTTEKAPPLPLSAVVEIRDTGPGIPREYAQQIFEPFFTTGKEGSGLGLYITRSIIEEMGGTISLLTPQEGRIPCGEARPGAHRSLRLPQTGIQETDADHLPGACFQVILPG